MAELLIALGLFLGVVWLISHTVFILVHADTREQLPSQPIDPISSYVLDNYGQHFRDDSTAVTEPLRKL